MQQRPLNQENLWQGAIQRAAYPKAVLKPQMHLPEINALTGKPTRSNLHETINESYAKYSENYWAGVAFRNRLYREATAAAASATTIANTPPAVSGVISRLAHSDS